MTMSVLRPSVRSLLIRVTARKNTVFEESRESGFPKSGR